LKNHHLLLWILSLIIIILDGLVLINFREEVDESERGGKDVSSREIPVTPIPMVLLAGMSALAVVMGIGRFAYTPILPLMQAGEGFSETVAGLVASANYGGYFLAALFSAFFSWPGGRTVWLRSHLVLNVLTTGIMGWLSDAVAWGVIRFLSGWSSGVVFVLSSNMVLDRLSVEGRNGWKSGVLYSGVGLGIAHPVDLVRFAGSESSWPAGAGR
jgi:MFS family permease